MDFETRAIHDGQQPDPATGSITVPIYQTSTFVQDGIGGFRGGYEYARGGNPTRSSLQTLLASLEDPNGGACRTLAELGVDAETLRAGLGDPNK